MSIGPDLKEVLSDVGTAYTIIRDSGNITGEFLDFETNAQVTKPFIKEFFLDAVLSYDTEAVVGDIIEFNVAGDRYLIMNKTPEMFENQVVGFFRYDPAAGGNDQPVVIVLAFLGFNRLFLGIDVDHLVDNEINVGRNEITFCFYAFSRPINPKWNKQPARLIVVHRILVNDSDLPFPTQQFLAQLCCDHCPCGT